MDHCASRKRVVSGQKNEQEREKSRGAARTVFGAHLVKDAVPAKAAADRVLRLDVVDHAAVAADVVGVEHQRNDLSDRKVDDRDVHYDRRHVIAA